MLLRPLAAALSLLFAAGTAAAEDSEARVNALLATMSLAEKLGQLSLVLPDQMDDPLIAAHGAGALMGLGGPDQVKAALDRAAAWPHAIPPLVALDVVHGYRTLFPVPIAEAATFDPEAARIASYWAAREASAAGINWTFGPMADVTRDVRWGRMVEGTGEDVHLAETFTAARVKGFREGGLMTSAKHFAGYGAGAGGRDYDAASSGPTEMRDLYLPPFKAAVDAGAMGIMAAFTAVDGMVASADPDLLTGVLRRDWGFRGFVTSDYAAIQELLAHGIAETPAEAARKAIIAGTDMEMVSPFYRRELPAEVAAGRVPVEVVDEAVRRVLRAKFALGLFDRARTAPGLDGPMPEARAAAREIAAESMVLLKNDGGTLPLSASVRRIAVIGSLADSARDLNGPHEAHGRAEETRTLLSGIRARAEAAGIAVTYEAGCEPYCRGRSGFDAAVRAAETADLVIAVMGESRDFAGEGATRAHLTLPGHQSELLDRLDRAGKPVALVLVGTRPLDLAEGWADAESVLMAWYPGSEGGPALADVIFGDVNPSGRLPITWPRSIGQVPIYYDHLPSGRPHDGTRFTLGYADSDFSPLYPFGYGLSYTHFRYSDLRILTPRVDDDDMVEIEVRLTNTGTRAGEEAAQLYVRDPVASRSRPVRQLKSVQKVALAPGETRTLRFRIPSAELAFHMPDGREVLEPGRFQVWIGANARADLGASFELVPRGS